MAWVYYGEKSCFRKEYSVNFTTATIAFVGSPESIHSFEAVHDLYQNMRDLASQLHLNAIPLNIYLSTGEPVAPTLLDLTNFENFYQSYINFVRFDTSIMFATVWSINDPNLPSTSRAFNLRMGTMGFVADPIPLQYGFSDLLSFLDHDIAPSASQVKVPNILDFDLSDELDLQVQEMLGMLKE